MGGSLFILYGRLFGSLINRPMTRLHESILDNISSDDRHPVPQEDIFKEYPDYLFIMANS